MRDPSDVANLRRRSSLASFSMAFSFAYALAGTGLAQVAFQDQADGSITANGSTLIGQNWAALKCTGLQRTARDGSMVAPTTPGPMPATGENTLIACSDWTKKPVCG